MTPPDQPESGPRRALYCTHQNQGKVTTMIAKIVTSLGMGGIITVEESPRLAEAEARIAELEREIDGADGWRDSCTFFEKRAEADERERDVTVLLADTRAAQMLTLARSCDTLRAENERLRAALEEIAVMDEQDEPYSAEIARKALERLVDGV